MSDNTKHKRIFIAYASEDEAAYETLMSHLKLLGKEIPIETWGKAELIAATQKDLPKAIENLQKAIDMGYDDKEFLQEEELLDSLRNHPEFQRILDSMKDENAEK